MLGGAVRVEVRTIAWFEFSAKDVTTRTGRKRNQVRSATFEGSEQPAVLTLERPRIERAEFFPNFEASIWDASESPPRTVRDRKDLFDRFECQ